MEVGHFLYFDCKKFDSFYVTCTRMFCYGARVLPYKVTRIEKFLLKYFHNNKVMNTQKKVSRKELNIMARNKGIKHIYKLSKRELAEKLDVSLPLKEERKGFREKLNTMARNRGIKYFYKLKMYELAEKLDVSLPESRKKKEPRKKEEPRKKKGSAKRQSVKVFNTEVRQRNTGVYL